MSRLPDRTARRALAAYRGSPPGDRLHVLVRWLSCPFAPVVDVLPRTGRVLEVGCGHGLFSTYLSISHPDLTVLGVDIDGGKIAVARATVGPREVGREFAVSTSGEVPPGPWDAVVLVDVLYLLDADRQRALLEACAGQLAPGGLLVVKDMATAPRWKARLNHLQETVAVRLLGITAGSPQFAFVGQDARAGWLTGAGLVDVRGRRLDRGRAHPHHVLVGRAAG